MQYPARIFFTFIALLLVLSTPATIQAEEEKVPDYKLMEDGTADLGKYQIEIFDPVLRKKLSVNFELLGAVQFDDQEKFMGYMKRHYYQLRELVNTTIRTCTSDQLTDPTHHTLNRKITSRVNRAFGWKFLKSVEPINYRLIQWSKEEGMVLIPLRPMPTPEEK
ncbi:MAG: hypothetical protein PVH19_01410 [Planctomycetia bacterium]|jgi:hypothetical protein